MEHTNAGSSPCRAAVMCFTEQRQLRAQIASPAAPPHTHTLPPWPWSSLFLGKLSEAKLCGAFSADERSQRFHPHSKQKTKIQKGTHLPVVWTERRVRGITLGSFPAHEIPQELFYCLQRPPLTGKGMHVATWRAHSGDQDKKKKKELLGQILCDLSCPAVQLLKFIHRSVFGSMYSYF